MFSICFNCAWNYQSIANNTQRIPKIKPFIDQYNRKGIDFPPYLKEWKKFEQKNEAISFDTLFVLHNTKEIRHAYKSNHNFKRWNRVLLLMIADGTKCHYLAVKSLSALLRGITSNDNEDFYCLNCFHSYSTKEELKKDQLLLCRNT